MWAQPGGLRRREQPAFVGGAAPCRSGIPAQAADLVLVDDAWTPLHHADKRAALSGVAHWLRPGGLLVLHEPLGRPERPAWWRRRLVAGLGHSGPVPIEFWTTACEHAGFEAPSPLGRTPEGVLWFRSGDPFRAASELGARPTR